MSVVRDRPAQTPSAETSTSLWDLLVMSALVILGYLGTAGRTVAAIQGPQVVAAVGAPLALIGLMGRHSLAKMKSYFPWAWALAFWILISGLAAWDSQSMRSGAIVAAWMTLILPGLVLLFRKRIYLNALLLGLALGVALFVTVAAVRILQDGPVLDVVDGEVVGHLIGVNRNGVNMSVLFVLPFLIIGVPPLRSNIIRWPLIVLSGLWIVHSGGRSGLLGLVMLLIVLGLVQPGLARRLKVLLAVSLVGTLGFTWIQTVGGEAAGSTDRITSLLRGERTESDETRELVLKKAWDLASKNPAFGVGWGRFTVTPSPVADQASSGRVYEAVNSKSGAHNAYALMMAEAGIPALAVFVLLLASVLLIGLRNSSSVYSRAATCALASDMFTLLFHTAIGGRLFLGMALVLALQTDLPHNPLQAAVGSKRTSPRVGPTRVPG